MVRPKIPTYLEKGFYISRWGGSSETGVEGLGKREEKRENFDERLLLVGGWM